MFKLIGATLFITASSLVGFDISRNFTLRTKQLRILIYTLQMMEAEMTFSFHSLQQIFFNIHKKTVGPIAGFYGALAEQLTYPVDNFYNVWSDELNKLKATSTLKNEDLEVMYEFGKNIGNHTIEQQQKQITLTIYYLQKQLDLALERKQRYEQMVKTVSVLLGIFIVLILI